MPEVADNKKILRGVPLKYEPTCPTTCHEICSTVAHRFDQQKKRYFQIHSAETPLGPPPAPFKIFILGPNLPQKSRPFFRKSVAIRHPDKISKRFTQQVKQKVTPKKWRLDLGKISRSFQGQGHLRSKSLNTIFSSFHADSKKPSLL